MFYESVVIKFILKSNAGLSWPTWRWVMKVCTGVVFLGILWLWQDYLIRSLWNKFANIYCLFGPPKQCYLKRLLNEPKDVLTSLQSHVCWNYHPNQRCGQLVVFSSACYLITKTYLNISAKSFYADSLTFTFPLKTLNTTCMNVIMLNLTHSRGTSSKTLSNTLALW